MKLQLEHDWFSSSVTQPEICFGCHEICDLNCSHNTVDGVGIFQRDTTQNRIRHTLFLTVVVYKFIEQAKNTISRDVQSYPIALSNHVVLVLEDFGSDSAPW